MDLDDSNAPHADNETTSAAVKPAKQVPWWRKTRNQVLAGVGTIVVGVLTGVIVAVVTARLPTPVPPEPTSTAVTPNPGLAGSGASGWSDTPTVLKNDYLGVTAAMQPDQGCKAATGWVFQQSPQQLAPLAPTGDPNGWALHNHGIPQSGNYITITAQGLNGHTVIIQSFGVKVLSRAAPPTGTAAFLTGGCGGLTPSFFSVNLDKPGLQATPVAGVDAAGHKIRAVPLPHVVTESRPEQWRLRVTTADCNCTFMPYFTWSSDGNQGIFYVTNHSDPWRIAAVTKARRAIRGANGRWNPF